MQMQSSMTIIRNRTNSDSVCRSLDRLFRKALPVDDPLGRVNREDALDVHSLLPSFDRTAIPLLGKRALGEIEPFLERFQPIV